jgi:hypothetical protein
MDLARRDLLRNVHSEAAVPGRLAPRPRDLRPTAAGRRIYALSVLGTHVTAAERETTAQEIVRLRDPAPRR